MGERLKGKKVLITGGTSGLGLETAKKCLDEGASVLITGRNREKAEQIAKELGEKALGFAADATILSDIDQCAAFAKEQLGHIDILFANAGGGLFGPIEEVDEEMYDKQFDQNVKSVFFTVQKILPLMREGGSIVLNASTVHSKAGPGHSLYYATKAAVRSFVRSMAAELGPRKIRVNSVSPGLIPTKFFENSNAGAGAFSQIEEKIISTNPISRPGKPEEIANAVIFLGSDEASYITAEDLVVDGGWMNI